MSIRLSPIQKEIVNHDAGALLVVAGPGSGKTRVLTERIRRLIAQPEGHFRVLALTFTNKAANEMRERIQEVPDIVQRAFLGTLHSFCVDVLATRGKAVGIDGLPHLFESYTDRKQVLLQAVQEDVELKGIMLQSGDAKEQNITLGRWLEMISDAKSNLLVPDMIEDSIQRRIYEAYDAGLKACAAVDFDDLLLLTYRLFEERPKIADFYRRQYKYICIDEAQDLNNAQYRLICALCSKEYSNIMMVGDPKQAIFAWNGADPKFMDLFAQDFNAKVIHLNENYRSSSSVVTAAQALNPLYAVEGQLPIKGEVKINICEDEEKEANFVIKRVEKLIESGHDDIEGSVTLDRCVVLARTKYVFTCLEKILKERGLSYYKQLSAQQESESNLLKQFELTLRVLINPLDRLHLGMLAKLWRVNRTVDEILAPFNLREATGAMVLNELVNNGREETRKAVLKAIELLEWTPNDFKFRSALDFLEQYASSCSPEDRELIVQDILHWRQHWEYFLRSEAGGHHNLSSFLSRVALGATQQPRKEGLGLLTVHSAKGLEFDVVFIIGMCEGIFPDYRANGPALEEEKRNAFVAITRSKRLLYLTTPLSRMMPWGSPRSQKPSRYLELLKAKVSP